MRHLSAAHLCLFLLTCAMGTAQADGWDDFSNNLAADLAPILALFGEQITTQFLSESTTIWDNFIFAMAPLGVITAVVSAIRVCGGSSLRAFIGRAQEGGGIAEAELCSSTSRDVCELYHNGAIVRVFGRPKILEIVHDCDAADKDFSSNDQTPSHCGIYSSREYIGTENAGWKEVRKHSRQPRKTGERSRDEEKGQSETSEQQLEPKNSTDKDEFAPNPNLSFNVGIKRRSVRVQRLAAAIAFLTQVSVLVFGGLVTSWGWKKEEDIPPSWAFPLMSLGTVLLCGGMFYCAFLVENSTKERVFRKDNNNNDKGKEGSQNSSSPPSTIYVVQPGNQVIGDQTFDPFLFDDSAAPINQYITSWKTPERSGDQLGVWLAIAMTMIGYGLQFVGLRAMHSAVSVLQLGAILLVSIIRALLRTQRLHKKDNRLHDRPEEVEGHELDWLALHMSKNERGEEKELSWVVTGPAAGLHSAENGEDNTEANGSGSDNGHSKKKSNDSSQEGAKIEKKTNTAPRLHSELGAVARTFYYRSRLAELTSQSRLIRAKSSTAWDTRRVPARQLAQQLKGAIESSVRLLFPKESDSDLTWTFYAAQYNYAASCPSSERVSLQIPLQKDDKQPTAWDTIQQHLEAMIGLWTWSIISDTRMEEADEFKFKVSKASEVPAFRIMAVGATREELERAKIDMQFWTDAFPSLEPRKLMVGTDSMGLGPGILWEKTKEDGTICSASLTMPSQRQSRLRLFGWQFAALPTSGDSSTEAFASTTPLPLNYSISAACALDIYQSFLYAIMGVPGSTEGQTKFSKGSRGFYLENEVISGLVECFKESNLGSTEDAFSVILPVLQCRSKLPYPTDTFPSTYNTAKDLRKGGKEVTALLLDRRGEQIIIAEEVVKAAAGNETNGEIVMMLLLNRQGKEITITEEVVKVAAGNERNGEEVMTLLLDRRGKEITITEEVVKAAAGNKGNSEKVMRLLLDRRGKEITITKEVVKAAAGNEWYSEEVITLLLDRRGKEITITEEVVKVAAGNERNGEEVITLLLDRRGKEITITEEVVKAAAGNERNSEEVITLLLDQRGDEIPITEEVVKVAAGNERNSEEVMTLLLDRRGKEITITEEVVKVAAGNKRNSKEVMTLLLDRRGKEITITKEVVKAAAGNKRNSKEVMTLLLDRRGKEITITEEVVKVTAGNERNSEEVMTLLLDRRGKEITITEEVVKAAAGNERNSKEVMTLLLDRRGDEIPITKEVVKVAAGNERNSEEVMTLLLDRRGKEITITEEVVKAAAGNETNGEIVIMLLLDRQGKEIPITKEVVKVAAGNETNSEIVMMLLLDRRGDEITITEEVVKVAAGNKRNSEEVITLLLDRRGKEITINKEVVKAAAGNKGNSEKVMRLLLDRRGKEITINKEVVKAAAGNEGNSKKVIRLLLNRRGKEITINKEVVKATAGNKGNSEKVMRLLLNRRGKEITINEEVVKAAAGNETNGKEVMTLLLDRRGDEITITEEVVKAAATCGQDQVLDFLSEQTVRIEDKWRYIAQFYNAAKAGDIRVIEQRIQKGVKPDVKDIRSATPLWIAADFGHNAVVKLLAERGDVDVNSKSVSGRPPLFWPASRGDEPIVATLMEAGADPTIMDCDGNTAIMMARKNGHEKIAKMLEGWNNETDAMIKA